MKKGENMLEQKDLSEKKREKVRRKNIYDETKNREKKERK